MGAAVGGRQRRLDDPRYGLALSFAHPEGHERKRKRASLVGAVEDLPVPQVPAPAERNRAGPDPAQRKCDLPEVLAFEDALLARSEQLPSRVGGDLAGLRCFRDPDQAGPESGPRRAQEGPAVEASHSGHHAGHDSNARLEFALGQK